MRRAEPMDVGSAAPPDALRIVARKAEGGDFKAANKSLATLVKEIKAARSSGKKETDVIPDGAVADAAPNEPAARRNGKRATRRSGQGGQTNASCGCHSGATCVVTV